MGVDIDTGWLLWSEQRFDFRCELLIATAAKDENEPFALQDHIAVICSC